MKIVDVDRTFYTIKILFDNRAEFEAFIELAKNPTKILKG